MSATKASTLLGPMGMKTWTLIVGLACAGAMGCAVDPGEEILGGDDAADLQGDDVVLMPSELYMAHDEFARGPTFYVVFPASEAALLQIEQSDLGVPVRVDVYAASDAEGSDARAIEAEVWPDGDGRFEAPTSYDYATTVVLEPDPNVGYYIVKANTHREYSQVRLRPRFGDRFDIADVLSVSDLDSLGNTEFKTAPPITLDPAAMYTIQVTVDFGERRGSNILRLIEVPSELKSAHFPFWEGTLPGVEVLDEVEFDAGGLEYETEYQPRAGTTLVTRATSYDKAGWGIPLFPELTVCSATGC